MTLPSLKGLGISNDPQLPAMGAFSVDAISKSANQVNMTPANPRDILAGTIYSGANPTNKSDPLNVATTIYNRARTANISPLQAVTKGYTEVGRDSKKKFEPFLSGDYSKGNQDIVNQAYQLTDQLLARNLKPAGNFNSYKANLKTGQNDYYYQDLGRNYYQGVDENFLPNRFAKPSNTPITSSQMPNIKSFSSPFEETVGKPGIFSPEQLKQAPLIRDIINRFKDYSEKGLLGVLKEDYASASKPPTTEQIVNLVMGLAGGLETKGGKIVSETVSKEAGTASKELGQATTKELPQAGQAPLSHTIPQEGGRLPLQTRIPSQAEKSMGEEVKGATDRLIEAIKTSAKPSRQELEKLYSAERAKRAGALAGIQEKGKEGMAGYYQQLGTLKGPLASIEKKSFSKLNLPEQDINSLMKAAKINPALDVYEKLNTQAALAKVLSGTIPTNSELSLLEKTYRPKLVDTLLSQRSTGQKILEGLGQVANLPRTIMASFDLSAPFRQGLMLVSHPKAFGSAFLSMFKQFGSEEAFKAVQESISKMPEYALMKRGKLALTDVGTMMTNREEKFMSSWAEKIPVLKYPIKASNRAYTGFLNKLRADVFTEIVRGTRAGGRELDEGLVRGIADFVNTASGRGGKIFGVSIGKSGPLLNGIFFSPRLMASRLTMLNPVSYITADPLVRKEMLKSVFTVLGSGLTVLGLAKMAGAKIGDNPNSSDFGKIITGNTRIDIWGGFQQYVRMASQLMSGKYVSTTTGKITTLGEGYKSLTRWDILQRQVESKEAPVLSFITDLLRQQDYTGKPISVPKEVASRFVPMVIGDLYDIAKQDPELLPVSLLGVFGVGLQTYGQAPSRGTGKGMPGIKNSPLRGNLKSLPSLRGIGL